MTLILVSLTVAIGFFGQAVFGFGGGLFCIPIISLLIGVKDAVTLVLILQLLIGVLVVYSYHLIDWQAVKPLLLMMVLGTVLGIFSMSLIDEQSLRLVLAAFIFSYLFKEFFFSEIRVRSSNLGTMARVCGLAAGWINGVIGTGGPPIVIYLNELGLKKEAFRACILMLLVASNITRIILSSYLGLITPEVGTYAIYAAPVALFAILLGQKLHGCVPQRLYTAIVYTILFASAATLTVKWAVELEAFASG